MGCQLAVNLKNAGTAYDGNTPNADGTPKMVMKMTATSSPMIPNAVRNTKVMAAIAEMPSQANRNVLTQLEVSIPRTLTAITVSRSAATGAIARAITSLARHRALSV